MGPTPLHLPPIVQPHLHTSCSPLEGAITVEELVGLLMPR